MKKYIYILLHIVALISVSCSDDELNSKDLLVFVRPQGATSLEILMSSTGEGGDNIDLKIPLSLTREAEVNVQAGLTVDEQLVDTYNGVHGTKYNLLPTSVVSFPRAVVTIPAGHLQSEDSVCVSISPAGLKGGDYLLPLAINEVISSDMGIMKSKTASVLYYKINIKIKYLSDDLEPCIGTLIETTDWEVICTQNDNSGTNLIDGDKSTNWKGKNRVENQIEIDMQKVQNVKGINFYYEASQRNYCPRQMKISISEDGEEWLDLGVAGSYVCSGYTNIKETFGINFLEAMSMRYFRLIPLVSSIYYAPQINEIEVIK